MINTDGVFSKYVQCVGCKDAADCTLKMIASEHHSLGLLSLDSNGPQVFLFLLQSPTYGQGAQQHLGFQITQVPDAWFC